MKYTKKLPFGKVDYQTLQEIVEIREIFDESAFDDWLHVSYSFTKEEETFLQTLISDNQRFIDTYSEEELKAHVLIPLVNKVNFFHNGIRDWYERPLKGVVNQVLLHGSPDYMVAGGVESPKEPYFFIQEYKKELGDKHPKNPLLAAMLVAMTLNGDKQMRGAFIIGRTWNFVLLKKLENNRYEYMRSEDYGLRKLHELKIVYRGLQNVKMRL